MIFGRTGTQEAMRKLIASIRGDLGKARNANELAAAEADVSVCEGVDAYSRKDRAAAVDKLLPWRGNAYRALGAGDAQRDVIGIMLGQAALKGGKHHIASAIFAQRIDAKANNEMSWTWFADTLSHSGHDKAAQQARLRAQQIVNERRVAARGAS